MKPGDHITIHDKRSFANGVIVAIGPPAELPEIPGERGDQVRAILATENFHEVALIEYDFLGTPIVFIALSRADGKWFDLRGSQLWIEPRTAENAADGRSRAG